MVKLFGSAVLGVDAFMVAVEVYVGSGIHYFMVGLPDNSVKESWSRIEIALKNTGFKMPRSKIVINLAPADIKKSGTAYDLPMALGILADSGQVKGDKFKDYIIMGELGLDGNVQPIRGALPIAIKALKEGFKGLILPNQNAREAAIVDGIDVHGINNILEVVDFLDEIRELEKVVVDTRQEFKTKQRENEIDFSDVKGQENIKRGMEIAAAGGHNLILIGPPGAGKTMLAKRLPTILPPLSLQEALETTKIHSVAGKLSQNGSLIHNRPFRSPHHTVSDVALVGGGKYPQPGEISLSHNGVLFLDELPEFKRSVLEVLRQPMEERKVTISRAKISITYPSSFMLIASMNPCPCGFYNHPQKECSCAAGMVQKYLNKISGPLLDRIDLHVEVTPVPFEAFTNQTKSSKSCEIRERVIIAREIQGNRYKDLGSVHCNAQMPARIVQEICKLDSAASKLLSNAMKNLDLSARAYDRILKVSRTIADLSGSVHIESDHVAEAIQFRNLDRSSWAG